MGDEFQKVKLAAVQAAPVFLDREKTVEKAAALIAEAGQAGADLIGFPEGFIPAHPAWYAYQPATGLKSLDLARRLFQNAVPIPSQATDVLCEACRKAHITAIIGLCEKRPNTTGTMYNTQLFIGPDGAILGKHQKIVATVGERLVHTGGYGDTMKSFAAPFGSVSGLICGENSNPLAVYALLAMNTMVHVAAWPPHFGGKVVMQDAIMAVSRGLAYSLSAFVINSVGIITEEAIKAYAETDADRAHLKKAQKMGAASIIGPSGNVIAGPLEAGEGILYADVDLNDVLVPKLFHDFSGHYNRFDIFSVHLNTHAPQPLNMNDWGTAPKGEDEQWVDLQAMEQTARQRYTKER